MEAFKQQLTLVLSLILMLLVALPVYRKAFTRFSAMEKKRIQRESLRERVEHSQQTLKDRHAFETVRFTGQPQTSTGREDNPPSGADAVPDPKPKDVPPACGQPVRFVSSQPDAANPGEGAPAQPWKNIQPVRFVSSRPAAKKEGDNIPSPRAPEPVPPAPSGKHLNRANGHQDVITVVFAEDDNFHKKS